MKKFVLIGIVVAVALIIGLSGCAAQKTYSITSGDYCAEVITDNSQVFDYLLEVGYTQGACEIVAGDGKCSLNFDTVDENGNPVQFTINYYWPADDYTTSQMESYCDILNGTWTAQ